MEPEAKEVKKEKEESTTSSSTDGTKEKSVENKMGKTTEETTTLKVEDSTPKAMAAKLENRQNINDDLTRDKKKNFALIFQAEKGILR